MTGFETAVVLAGGAGHRLKAIAEAPKALLPLSGVAGDERFIDAQLVALAKVGARAVVIVGPRLVVRAPMRSILTLGPGVEVRFVQVDDDPAQYGSGHSVATALREAADLTHDRRLALVQATTLASPSVWERLAEHDASRTAVVVDGTVMGQHDRETVAWVAPDVPERIGRIGRGLEGTPVSEGLARAGTIPGITAVAAADVARLGQILAWGLAHTSGGPRFRFDEALQVLAERGAVDAVLAGADDVVQAVRTPEDYARFTADIWPALKAMRG
jgi:choline kinase